MGTIDARIVTPTEAADLVAEADLVAIVPAPEHGLGFATDDGAFWAPMPEPFGWIASIAEGGGPRWAWFDDEVRNEIAHRGLAIDRCWDAVAVHRILHPGSGARLADVWARMHGLPPDGAPVAGQLDLGSPGGDDGDPTDPIRPDGYLRPEWWSSSPDDPTQFGVMAELVLRVVRRQLDLVDGASDPRRTRSLAHADSAAQLLCAELEAEGLPIHEEAAIHLITEIAGPPASTPTEDDAVRAARDAPVLAQLRTRSDVNLRNPAAVKAMLKREGFDLPDTRAWRLESLRTTSPLIDALLEWRKAERIATTYGWTWMRQHVEGGRLRGSWSASDGAAGRMTASAGLHNLPAVMREVVAAEPGHRFVRADLGQIEPRVLAAVSGDPDLIHATQQPDLYAPIAQRLGVEREVAKVAVLGAMYGATTGASAGALAGLNRNYPVAMGLLEEAAEAGRRMEDVFTLGGRRIRMWQSATDDGDLDRAVSAAASRGRYARNAVIQGSAAEFFKVWAITVRRHGRVMGARVVLCLHDELLVHVPADRADEAAAMVEASVAEAARYWSPRPDVRFAVDVSVIDRWSEAKG